MEYTYKYKANIPPICEKIFHSKDFAFAGMTVIAFPALRKLTIIPIQLIIV